MTQRKIEYWVIPPQADAEFVAHLEQVLDTYAQPYDPACPVVCMDEQPVQLVKETRPPIAATQERPRRVDYEYERAGTASDFLFSKPLAGWRQATARARRTKADWAVEVAGLLGGRYADCPQVTLVCDNLNTHTKGAFYEVFEPTRARELVRRIEFCYTPKHGSWLNIAENELRSLTRQCLHGRHIGDLGTLHVIRHTTAMHLLQAGVDMATIALRLGHERLETTHHYVEADLRLKECALRKLDPLGQRTQRFKADSSLLTFLARL